MHGEKLNPLFSKVQRAVAEGRAGKEVWLGFIREAQALPEGISWMGCYTLVQLAQTRAETAAAIKAVALDLYEPGALAGNTAAVDLLWNFADMAGDLELLRRFTVEVQPLTEEEIAADRVLDTSPEGVETQRKVRAALGIGDEYELTLVASIPTARRVYRRPDVASPAG